MGRRSPTLDEWRGSVSADLDNLKEKLDEGFERLEKALAEHAALDQHVQTGLTTRLTAVENKQSNMVGKMTVYALIGGSAIGIASQILVAWMG